MSLWKKIKDEDDVELSEDGKTLEVLYDTDKQGNYYIEIPIEIVRKAMGLRCKYIWTEGAGCSRVSGCEYPKCQAFTYESKAPKP